MNIVYDSGGAQPSMAGGGWLSDFGLQYKDRKFAPEPKIRTGCFGNSYDRKRQQEESLRALAPRPDMQGSGKRGGSAIATPLPMRGVYDPKAGPVLDNALPHGPSKISNVSNPPLPREAKPYIWPTKQDKARVKRDLESMFRQHGFRLKDAQGATRALHGAGFLDTILNVGKKTVDFYNTHKDTIHKVGKAVIKHAPTVIGAYKAWRAGAKKHFHATCRHHGMPHKYAHAA